MKKLLSILFAIVAIAGTSFAASLSVGNVDGSANVKTDYNPYVATAHFMNLDNPNAARVLCSVAVTDVTYRFDGVAGEESQSGKYAQADPNCGSTGSLLCKIRFDNRITLAQALAGMPAGPYTNGQTYTVNVTIGGVPTTITVTIFTKA